MERCVYCQGVVDPGTRSCQQCGRAQPVPAGGTSGAGFAVVSAPTRRCPSCGDEVPAKARFCGNCAQPLPSLTTALPASEEWQRQDSAASGPGLAPSGGWPGFPAAPAVPAAPASSQSGMPAIQNAPAGAQSNAPYLSAPSAGPQSSFPRVPVAPPSPQSGAFAAPAAPASSLGRLPAVSGAPAPRPPSRAPSRGLRETLFGTAGGKVLLALMLFALLGGGAIIVLLPKLNETSANNGPAKTPTATAVSAPTITLSANAFSLPAVTIHKGSTITFVDDQVTGALHILVIGSRGTTDSEVGAPDFGGEAGHPFSPGQSWTTPPWTKTGSYHVTCLIHPVTMNLLVIVVK